MVTPDPDALLPPLLEGNVVGAGAEAETVVAETSTDDGVGGGEGGVGGGRVEGEAGGAFSEGLLKGSPALELLTTIL